MLNLLAKTFPEKKRRRGISVPIIIEEGKGGKEKENQKETITTTCKWERKALRKKEGKKNSRCKYYFSRVNRFSGSEKQMIFKRFENVKWDPGKIKFSEMSLYLDMENCRFYTFNIVPAILLCSCIGTNFSKSMVLPSSFFAPPQCIFICSNCLLRCSSPR